jgi:hypothetical protein
MAFNGCDELYSLLLGTGVRNIGEMAFYQCTSLTASGSNKLIIPSEVISIEKMAFNIASASDALLDVQFNEGLLFIGEEAFSHAAILRLTLPDTLETIGVRAFAYCYYLTKINIGRGIRLIDNEAFRYAGTNGLYVEFTSSAPPESIGYVLGNITRNNFYITVPEDSQALYENADNWSYYESKMITIEISDEVIVYPNR